MSSQSTVSNDNKRRKVINSEGRSMIASVYHFLKEEYEFSKLFAEPNTDLSHLQNISLRTAEAAGVSLSTVQRILREEKKMPSTSSKFNCPLKRKKRGSKIEIDNFTADVVRNTIHNFHTVQKEIPTLVKLKTVLNEKMGFDGCLQTLRTFLLKLGYKWRKNENNRKVLTERHDVQMLRLKYLKKISEYRTQGRPIVYTYSNTSKFLSNCFIFAYAGTKDGFIENASLLYKTNSIASDYHSNMSYDNYIQWLNENLLPNLPESAVIVLNNDIYHNKRSEKLPTSTTKKAEMQQWLGDKGIPFEESLLKLELYDLIKKHINKNIKYEVDELIESKGFDVIRLPPYHPELNAVENIWGIVKKYIALNSMKEIATNMEQLINESLNKITNQTWENSCNHIEQMEKEYLKYCDLDFEFVMDLQNDSDDSESESECYVSDSN